VQEAPGRAVFSESMERSSERLVGRHRGLLAGLAALVVSFAVAARASYGYQGDPLRPLAGKHYGYLIRAGLY